MKTTLSRLIAIILLAAMLTLTLASCTPVLTPAVNIGIKRDGSEGNYNESIQDIEIGKRFHGAIKLTLKTDQQAAEEYTVVVELPKTKDVEVIREGGLRPDRQVEDSGKTTLTFTVQGYKEAVEQNIQFIGTPFDEGVATITVMIYDKEGVAVNAGYDKTLYFVYELES